MKRGKRLTRKQKEYLNGIGLNPKEWLLHKVFNENMILVSKFIDENGNQVIKTVPLGVV